VVITEEEKQNLMAASLVLNTVTSEFDRKPASVMLNDVFRGEK
jgi:hypothetical protein